MRLLNEPGDQSHTVAELAARHPVTVGTAYAAMALLNDEGLIEVTRHQPVAAGHRLDPTTGPEEGADHEAGVSEGNPARGQLGPSG